MHQARYAAQESKIAGNAEVLHSCACRPTTSLFFGCE